MKQSNSQSQEPENPNSNWMRVLFEIIIKILTLGFYHLERHRSNNGAPK